MQMETPHLYFQQLYSIQDPRPSAIAMGIGISYCLIALQADELNQAHVSRQRGTNVSAIMLS